MKPDIFEARLAEALKTRTPTHKYDLPWHGEAHKHFTFPVEVRNERHQVVTVEEHFRRINLDCSIKKQRLVTQKFLCIGGPHAGEWHPEDSVEAAGYTRFGAASFNRHDKKSVSGGERRNALLHSSLWSND